MASDTEHVEKALLCTRDAWRDDTCKDDEHLESQSHHFGTIGRTCIGERRGWVVSTANAPRFFFNVYVDLLTNEVNAAVKVSKKGEDLWGDPKKRDSFG